MSEHRKAGGLPTIKRQVEKHHETKFLRHEQDDDCGKQILVDETLRSNPKKVRQLHTA